MTNSQETVSGVSLPRAPYHMTSSQETVSGVSFSRAPYHMTNSQETVSGVSTRVYSHSPTFILDPLQNGLINLSLSSCWDWRASGGMVGRALF